MIPQSTIDQILEAARMDGATLRDEIIHVLTPMAVPGIASTMAIAPILILGWFSQKQLVRGLTFGAVK